MEYNIDISKSISLSSLTFLVFLTLKLTNVINWSWWWITAPLWIPLSITLIVFIIFVIVYFIRSR